MMAVGIGSAAAIIILTIGSAGGALYRAEAGGAEPGTGDPGGGQGA